VVTGEVDDVLRPRDVDIEHGEGSLVEVLRAVDRGEVEDDVRVVGRVRQFLFRPDVALDERHVVDNVVETVPRAAADVVEYRDVVAVVDEFLDEVGADEPSAAGDEYLHVSVSSARKSSTTSTM
jgi:hypothetical protein